jgi:hypothetical protein
VTAPCAFIGDCIAIGIALASPLPCDVRAKMGRAPAAVVAAAPTDRYLWAIISAGSNPAGQLPSRQTLRALRTKLRSGQILWVLPAAPSRAAIVRAVAAEHGDLTVPLGLTARDRVHPRSYATLWRAAASQLGLIVRSPSKSRGLPSL